MSLHQKSVPGTVTLIRVGSEVARAIRVLLSATAATKVAPYIGLNHPY